jgi:hypothetical protein
MVSLAWVMLYIKTKDKNKNKGGEKSNATNYGEISRGM